jgi:hypothetical protein
MRIFAAVFSEIWHLFVDDGRSAAAIIVWPCIIWLLDRRGLPIGLPASAMLTVGMIVILVAGTMCKRRPGESE